MRKIIFTLSLFLTSYLSHGQIIGCYWSEDMEPIDSVTSITTTGLGGFFPNTRLFTSSTKCDSASVVAGDTTYLESFPIDVQPFTFIVLRFNHICKIDFFDKATVWVHSDFGAIHQQLTAANFVDTNAGDWTSFGNQGGSFQEATWGGTWLPGQIANPDSSWWRSEAFDISFMQGLPDLKIIFQLEDANNPGGNGRAGWFIDDICVQAAPCELTPPNIVAINPPQGTVYSLGPYNTTWSITDASGIDTNTTWLYWTVNGINLDSIKLVYDPGSQLYIGTIPAVNDSDTICYYATATDISACANSSIYPASGCIQFIASQGIGFPYCDDFNAPQQLWVDSGSVGTPWEWGIPTTGTPSAALSPPNVWEVGLNSAYNNSSSSDLYSPHVSFQNAVNATLSVWLNYATEQNWDGVRLEYSHNGGPWTILGTNPPDINGTNWYTNTVNCSAQPAWAGQSTNIPGNINGWYKAEYQLGANSPTFNFVGDVQFRFHFCSDASVIVQGFAIDNFCITLPSPQDAGVTQILQPGAQGAAGVCLPIIVTIKNFGTQSITSTDVYYNLNGVVHGPYTWTGLLQPGFVVNDTLPCDTIPIGPYSICSWTDLLNDGNHFNDTTCSSGFGFPVVTPTVCDDFESGSPGWQSSPAVANSAWQLGTPAFGATTGAHSGTNAWDINLTTPYTFGAFDTLFTPIYDVQTAVNPYISFWHNRNTTLTQDGYWIEYTVNSGTTWQTLGSTLSSTNGEAISWYNDPSLNFTNQNDFGGNSNGWVKSTFFIQSVLSGPFIQFRFVFQSAQFGNPLDGVSIDDFCMTLPPAIDAGAITVTGNSGPNPPEATQDSVTVTIRNFGSTPFSSTDVYFNVNNGTPIGPYTWTSATPLLPGFTATFILSGLSYTVPVGQYTIRAWTDLTGDGDHSNDTTSIDLFGVHVYQLTSCDDLEGNNYWQAVPATGTTVWELGTPNFGATTGAHSGVNAWDINLNSAYGAGFNDTLYTPIYDVSTNPLAQYAILTFWQNRNTTTQNDGLWLEYTVNGGTNWQTLGFAGIDPDGYNWYNQANLNFFNQNAWDGNSGGWVKCTYFLHNSLVGNNGYIRFRFIFHSYQFGFPQADGVSIDDFCVTIPPPVDVGVVKVTSASGGQLPAGALDSVSVTIRNFGTSPVNNIPIYFDTLGGAPVGPYIYTGTLTPQNSAGPFILSGFNYQVPAGQFQLCSWTDLASDGDHSNDTSCTYPVGVPTIYVTYSNQYCDNFDATNIGYTPEILPAGDPGTIWELGFPAFGATTGAHSPPNAWDINLTTGYGPNSETILSTPIFNIPANGNPKISLWRNNNTEQNWDGVRLEYTTNGGFTWNILGAVNDPLATNWYTNNVNCSGQPAWAGNSNGWIFCEYPNSSNPNALSALNGQNVQFRFYFCTDASVNIDGFSIDDFCVNIPNPLTVAPTSITNNGVGFCIFPGQCVQFNSVVKNLGTTPITKANAVLTVDGVLVSSDTINYSPALNFNGTSTYTFNNCWTATAGTHTICVYTFDPNGSPDLNTADDTICVSITVCDSVNITNGSQYCTGFEPGSNTWVTTNAVTYSTATTSWQQGSPSKTFMTGPFAGSNCWVTKLSGQYPANDKSALFSPLFIVAPNTSYKLEFETKFKTEAFQDGGTLEYSTNFGLPGTWVVLGNNLDPNWMNTFTVTALNPTPPPIVPGWTGTSAGTNGWEHKEHQVCFPGGGGDISVIYRFRFYTDLTTQDEGWAVDNFCMTVDPSTPCTVGMEDNTPVAIINLSQNFPNPAAGTTSFVYSIPDNGAVEVKITDMLGRIIDVPVSEKQVQGIYKVDVNTDNYASGIYYYSLKWKDQIMVRKMVVSK